jgi:hypothetical protein
MIYFRLLKKTCRSQINGDRNFLKWFTIKKIHLNTLCELIWASLYYVNDIITP